MTCTFECKLLGKHVQIIASGKDNYSIAQGVALG